jgi:hypothetical protein
MTAFLPSTHPDVNIPLSQNPGHLPHSVHDIFSSRFASYFAKFSTLVPVAKTTWTGGAQAGNSFAPKTVQTAEWHL